MPSACFATTQKIQAKTLPHGEPTRRKPDGPIQLDRLARALSEHGSAAMESDPPMGGLVDLTQGMNKSRNELLKTRYGS